MLPEDFGLIALATTYIGFITIFTSIGFGSAVIYYNDLTKEQISTLYWFNFLLSLIAFLVITGSAPFAADFYNEPDLVYVVWLAAVSVIITPFFTIHYKIKERDLEFNLLSRITIFSTLIGSIAAVIFAILGFGVYALVAQIVFSTFFRMVFILFSSNWKPERTIKFNDVKSMIWYSLKFKTSRSVLYIERNIDYLILGRLFSPTILGFYAFAYNIMYTPVKRISYIFSDILFPSLSAIKDDQNKIIKGYFQSLQLIAMISFPVMTLLAFNAELIIPFFFGNKWNGAIPIVQILAFAGALQSISQFGGVIFSSIGKPEVNIYIAIPRAFLIVVAILGGSFYGILTVAYFILSAKAISFIIMIGTIYKFIKFSLTQFLGYLKGPIITTLMLGAIQLISTYIAVPSLGVLKFISMIVAVCILTLIFHSKMLKEIFSVIKLKVSVA